MKIKLFIKHEKLSILTFALGLLLYNLIVILGIFSLELNHLLYFNLLLTVTWFTIMFISYIRFRSQVRRFEDVLKYGHYELLLESEISNDALVQEYQKCIKAYHEQWLDQKQSLVDEKESFVDYITAFVHAAKTPLTAMKLILEGNELEDSDVGRKIEDERFKLENCVEQALYYTRMDAFEKDYYVQSYSMKGMISAVVKRLSRIFIEKKITLKMDISDDDSIITDKKSFEFVIFQILSNSLKYLREKGVIEISFYKNGKEKVLTIRDNGTGIKAEDLPRVFEKGFTGYNGRVNEHSTGIGLYIVKNLCTKLGHDITMTSEYGVFTETKIVI